MEPLDPTVPIVLVEDLPALRSVIARTLRKLGYTVLEAEGRVEAAEAVPEGPYLLLTDVHLEDGDGIDLAADLLTESPDAEVVFMSGDEAVPIDRIPEPHVRGVLLKPFLLEELKSLLDGEGGRSPGL